MQRSKWETGTDGFLQAPFQWSEEEQRNLLEGKIDAGVILSFADLLSQVESRTGERYSITLNQFASNSNGTEIGAFHGRNEPVEVFHAIDDYKELLGKYESVAELHAAVKARQVPTLSRGRMMEDGEYSFECRVCGVPYPRFQTCQKLSCLGRMQDASKWQECRVFEHGTIGLCGGGSLCVVHTVAQYAFIYRVGGEGSSKEQEK